MKKALFSIACCFILSACGSQDEPAADAAADAPAAAPAAPAEPPAPEKAFDVSKSLADVTDAEWDAFCAETREAKGGGGLKVQCDGVKTVTVKTQERCLQDSKQVVAWECDLKLEDLYACQQAQIEDQCGNNNEDPRCASTMACMTAVMEKAMKGQQGG